MRFAVRAFFASLLLAVSMPVFAAPFTVTAQLTGDPRLSNPDNIVVNVTITGDTLSNVTSWVVAPFSVAHPSSTLDAFGFNVLLNPGVAASFGNFSPTGWTAPSVDATLAGSGATTFQFVFNDPPKPINNVTNLIPLTFDMTLSAGTFSLDTFLLAPTSFSNDCALGGAKLGAHVRSLNPLDDESDSGVVFGDYVPPVCQVNCDGNGGDTGNGGDNVPEPTTMSLVGLGLIAAGIASRGLRR